MSKPYYTLAVLKHGRWSPEFGDYDRETVDYEFWEYREKGYRKTHLKIIESGSKQADIEAAIADLNQGQR